MDEKLLRDFMALHVSEDTINEYGRFDELKSAVDFDAAKRYYEEKYGKSIRDRDVFSFIDKTLREFILAGGFDT